MILVLMSGLIVHSIHVPSSAQPLTTADLFCLWTYEPACSHRIRLHDLSLTPVGFCLLTDSGTASWQHPGFPFGTYLDLWSCLDSWQSPQHWLGPSGLSCLPLSALIWSPASFAVFKASAYGTFWEAFAPSCCQPSGWNPPLPLSTDWTSWPG